MGLILFTVAPLLPIIFPFFLVYSSGKLILSPIVSFVKKWIELFRG